MSRFSSAPQEGHLDLARRIFGYLNFFSNRGYIIDPQALTIDDNYDKVKMKYDLGNKYAYFSEKIDDDFPKYLLDELEIHVLWYAEHSHDKVTMILITGLFSVVESKTTTWSSKRQTAVQTSTFGANFTLIKKAIEESVMTWYHLVIDGDQGTQTHPYIFGQHKCGVEHEQSW